MSADQSKSLLERVEIPAGLSPDSARKIAHLEEEFTRAEVEMCMLFPFSILFTFDLVNAFIN